MPHSCLSFRQRCSKKVKLDPGEPKKGSPKEGSRTRGAERKNLRERGADPGELREILDIAKPGSRGAEKRDAEKIIPGEPKKGVPKKQTPEAIF